MIYLNGINGINMLNNIMLHNGVVQISLFTSSVPFDRSKGIIRPVKRYTARIPT